MENHSTIYFRTYKDPHTDITYIEPTIAYKQSFAQNPFMMMHNRVEVHRAFMDNAKRQFMDALYNDLCDETVKQIQDIPQEHLNKIEAIFTVKTTFEKFKEEFKCKNLPYSTTIEMARQIEKLYQEIKELEFQFKREQCRLNLLLKKCAGKKLRQIKKIIKIFLKEQDNVMKNEALQC